MPPKAPADTTKRDNTTPSCAVCNRRKVKCDRVYPCAPCKKTGLECSFPGLSRKRRKTKPPATSAEIFPEGSIPGPQDGQDLSRRSNGDHDADEDSRGARRLSGSIGYELFGNNVSTTSISPSFAGRKRIDDGAHSNLVFGPSGQPHHQPLSISWTQAMAIGNSYRTHVDPVVKVFHCNSAWTCMSDSDDPGWSAEGMDLRHSADQCLFRAVCFVTAVATEGTEPMGSPELVGHELIERCRVDVEAALSAAQFMRTKEFRVLQAFVLYLIARQSLGDDETVWTMLGVSIRVASTLGLPQDLGEEAASSQSRYRLEMRRRLWWAIIALDARVTRILGRTGYLSHNFSEIPRPASVDDTNLFPTMDSIPDADRVAESIYVRYRATLSDVLPFIYGSGAARDKCTGLMEMIDDAEREIEEQFIQHIDKTVPIQLLTFVAGRGYIKRVKLAMFSIFPDTNEGSAQTMYAPEAFWLAKESMDIFILLWTDPSLKQWQWHWKDFFGWHTLRVLVKEIAKRSTCSKVIEAWRLVKKAAGLAVSVLKLGEEKARLVGDLRMLIEAGDVPSRTPRESSMYGGGSMVQSIRPGMGTNPHNAMFPAMNSSFNDDHERQDEKENISGNDEFDLKRVNWTEMDRILLQLGIYNGS